MTSVALEATPARLRTATLLPALAAVVVALAAWWAGAPYVVGVFHDDGVYALLAKSIATGQGFHYIGLPGAPAATHYPPLYPLLLAAAWRVAPTFPDNLSVLLGLNALLLGVAAIGAYRFVVARLAWREVEAALFATVAMITAPVLALSSALLSESLFLAALWPALALAERAASGDESRDAVAAGAAVGALMLVRMHALALLAALVLVLVARRRMRHAVLAAASAVVVLLPWQLWTMLATPRVAPPLEGSYGSYVGWFASGVREGGASLLFATARTNLSECWLLLRDRVAFGGSTTLDTIAALLLAALIGLGAWAMARRAVVTMLFLAIYLAIVVVWPFAPWRFVWAVWPVVLLLAIEGARASRARSAPRRAAVAIALALPALAMATVESMAYARQSWLAPARAAGGQITPLVRWVGRHTRPDDVLLSEGEQVVSLFTGRRAAPVASFTAGEYVTPVDAEASRATLRAMLGAVPARYVLALMPATQGAARSLATSHPGLREIGVLPEANAVVFEVVP